jgi:hypothetical protein
MKYSDFIQQKTKKELKYGFHPIFMPDILFDFQKFLVEWSVEKGRSAIYADCGLGKTFIQLTWAENVAQYGCGRVLILAPLAVAPQTVKEGIKLGVEVIHRREGIKSKDRIVITNYERLHYFDPNDFVGIVCDESSILKNYSGKIKEQITEFMQHHKYRLLCTATAAPNDFMELGTSSEALGVMRRVEMLGMYFSHDSGETSKWRIKGHAENDFWSWVATWARTLKTPSDLGFDDSGFILPELILNHHTVNTKIEHRIGLLGRCAITLNEQRDDLRKTLNERCEMVANLTNSTGQPAVVWCNLNQEGDLLDRLIPDGIQISGSDSEEKKECAFLDFVNGKIRILITKPSIAGFGLNWQHCNHQTFFPSHSFETFYQATRRCWRFGQKRKVIIDIITTNGQYNVLKNMKRKQDQSVEMYQKVLSAMNQSHDIKAQPKIQLETQQLEIPSWIK